MFKWFTKKETDIEQLVEKAKRCGRLELYAELEEYFKDRCGRKGAYQDLKIKSRTEIMKRNK